jgi:hypothetical protein
MQKIKNQEELVFFDINQSFNEWELLADRLQLKKKSVFSIPAFYKVYKDVFDLNSGCFFFRINDSYIYYPFLIKEIKDAYLGDEIFFDIDQPDGLGGIYCNKINEELVKKFQNYFKIFCEKKKIISGFNKLNPFYDYLKIYPTQDIFYEKSTVSVDLNLEFDQILKKIKPKTIIEFRKSLKENFSFRVYDKYLSFETIDSKLFFMDKIYSLYTESMKKNNAKTLYKKIFFEEILKYLPENSELYYVLHSPNNNNLSADNIACWELVLFDQEISYSFFSGSDSKYNHLHVNRHLKIKMLEHIKNKGIKQYFLGGGYKDKDGIYQYKKNYAHTENSLDFFVTKSVYNKKIFENLCNNATLKNKNIPVNFFQKYRYINNVLK